MKLITIAAVVILTGCATGKEYQQYIEQTTRVQQAINASEAACLLVLAEAMKTADPVTKAAISIQIDKCRKEPPKLEAPRGIFNLFD